MNKKRRKALEEIASQVEELRESLQGLLDEEEEAYSNMPESLLCSERNQYMYDGISSMEESVSSLDDVADNLRDIIENYDCL